MYESRSDVLQGWTYSGPSQHLIIRHHTHAYTCTFFSIFRLRLGSKKVRYGSWYSWPIIYELSLSFLYLKSWHCEKANFVPFNHDFAWRHHLRKVDGSKTTESCIYYAAVVGVFIQLRYSVFIKDYYFLELFFIAKLKGKCKCFPNTSCTALQESYSYVAFSDWLFLFRDMHVNFLHVFSWLARTI